MRRSGLMRHFGKLSMLSTDARLVSLCLRWREFCLVSVAWNSADGVVKDPDVPEDCSSISCELSELIS